MNNLFISVGTLSSVVKTFTTSLVLLLAYFAVIALITSQPSKAQERNNGIGNDYEISFSRVKHTSIEEGSSTLFFFTTSPGVPAWSTLEVEVDVYDEEGDVLDELNWDRRGSTSFYNGGGKATLLFRGSRRDVRNGYSTARIRVLTDDDDVDEPDSEFTVAVMDGPGYRANPNKRGMSVMVRDNDEDIPIVLSLTRYPDNGKFVPGGKEFPNDNYSNIHFQVCVVTDGQSSRMKNTPKNLTVNYRIDGNRDLIGDASATSPYWESDNNGGELVGSLEFLRAMSQKIVVSANAMPGWSAQTIRDSIGVTLLPGKGYKVGPEGLCANGETYDRITNYDQGLPWLGVIQGAKYVVEGQPAPFGIVGNVPQGTQVNFEVVEGLNFISRKQSFVEIPGNVLPSLLDSLPGSVNYTKHGKAVQHTLKIQTDDDSLLENDGFITVRILPGEGYRVLDYDNAIVNGRLGIEYASVMIIDNDQSPSETQQAIANYIVANVPVIIRNQGANSQSAFALRMEAGANPANSFELGGNSDLSAIIQNSGEHANDGSLSSVFGDSAFSLTLLEESGKPVSVWGLGKNQEVASLSSEQGQWEGDEFTTQFGIDTWLSDETVLGVSASLYERNVEHQDYDHTMQMTTLSPYYGWSSEAQDFSLLMFGSIGTGEVTFDHNFGAESAETNLYMTSIGGQKELYSGDQTEVELTGEALIANLNINENGGLIDDMNINTHQFQAAIIGSKHYELATGQLLPSIAIGFKSEGGDLDDWTGTEISSGIAYDTNDLSISGEGDVQMSWDQQHDWGLNATLDYDTGHDSQAVQLSLSATIGNTNDDNLNAIQRNQLANLADNSWEDDSPQWTTELGYGFNILDQLGSFTPYTGLDFNGMNSYGVSMGSRIAIGSNFNFEIEGLRSQAIDTGSSNEFNLKVNTTW